MDADEIEQSLRVRAADFAKWLFPDGRQEGKAWVTDNGSLIVQGLKAGTWSKGGTLVQLCAKVQFVPDADALSICADWLRNPSVKQVEQPVPISVNDDAERLTKIDEEMASLPQNVVRMQPAPTRAPAPSKMLPSSEGAEAGLIGSAINNADFTLELCAARGVRPEWFHIPAYRILFGFMVAMRASRKPVDLTILTQVLRDHGQLDAVGGAVALTQLFMSMPTAANAGHYIDIIKDKFTLRELIRTSGEIERGAYEDQSDPVALLKRAQSNIEDIAQRGGAAGLKEQLSAQSFDLTNPPPQPVPLFSLGESILATAGNIMAIQAKAKAGKTALLGAMMASTMEPVNDVFGFVSQNKEKHALIHFDTEQSPWDHHNGMLRVLKRAGREEKPPWLRSYRVAETPLQMRLEMIRYEMKRAKEECGGILALIIDGIGDLCVDVNDSAEAIMLVDEIHQLAIKFNTVIVCVLHENPGSEIAKTRGHLGSQLERKAETNLRLEKDAEGVTVVFTERARNTHIPKERGAKFAWNDEAKMHLSTTAEFCAKPKNRGEFSNKWSQDTVLSRLSLIDGVTPAKLKKDLLDIHGMSARTYHRYLAELHKAGKIEEREGMFFLKGKKRE